MRGVGGSGGKFNLTALRTILWVIGQTARALKRPALVEQEVLDSILLRLREYEELSGEMLDYLESPTEERRLRLIFSLRDILEGEDFSDDGSQLGNISDPPDDGRGIRDEEKSKKG